MVATSKMKKAQDSAKSGRPYALLLADIIVSIADEFLEVTNDYFMERPVKHRGILVIGTDKGLCGALTPTCFGCFPRSTPRRSSLPLGNGHPNIFPVPEGTCWRISRLPDKPSFSDIRKMVEFLLRNYNDGNIDTIEVLYTSFINTLRQEPELIRLFPLNDLDEMSAKLHERFGIEDHEVPKDE